MNHQELKAKTPADLLAYAEELEIENATVLRKQDIMFAILKHLAENDQPIYGAAALARGRGDCVAIARLTALFEEFPSLPANSLTREAVRLIGDRGAGRLGACEQQGLQDLYRRAVA